MASIATGGVTIASRAVELEGLAVRQGEWLGLVDGVPVAGGGTFAEVAAAVVERLLGEPRELVTMLTGVDAPPLEQLVARLGADHPEITLEVQEGGQPHYALLLSAE